MPDLTTETSRAEALEQFRMSVYADSSRTTLSFKWRTVTRMFAAWGVEPFPPSPQKVALLGAAPRAGGYRSAPSYLSLFRTTAARHGHPEGA